jgi:hypothetical protein
MSLVAAFGQKQRTDPVTALAHLRPVVCSAAEGLVRQAERMIGRGLFVAGTVAVVLVSAGLAMALGGVGQNIVASHPTIIAAPPPSMPSEHRLEDVVQTTKSPKVTDQQAVDLLAVQDLVVPNRLK